MNDKKYTVAVVGATGEVGGEMTRVLEERNFPVGDFKPLASKRSAGMEVMFNKAEYIVEELNKDSFEGVDIALFSAGSGPSRDFAPVAAKAGCIVIDNSKAWRMDSDVPLVVPEVNPHAVGGYKKKGIIANPNCSTIQMVVALNPIKKACGIERIVVATYQAVSGTGKQAILEMEQQIKAIMSGQAPEIKVYPHRIAFNCLPHIGPFLDNGYTEEEMKMLHETRKILEDDTIMVSATTVRVPVFYGHSESINIKTRKKLSAMDARALLFNSPGIKVMDNPDENIYPMPMDATGGDETLVGRIREDISQENGLEIFVVADNIRKGAALNAVQIAEVLIKEYI